MIRINLLPPDLYAHESKFNPMFIVVGAPLVLALVLIPLTFHQYSVRNRQRSEIKSIQSELDRYAPIIAQIESLEKGKQQLVQRKNLIQQLESERLRYPQFMDDFLKLLPGNVWLTNLTPTQPNEGTILLQMDVVALDNYAIADFIANLETSQLFTDIELGAIAAAPSPTLPVLNFHLSANYKRQPGMGHVR